MPLGAFVSSERIMKAFRNDPPLCHVTTFGGHPVSCAAALANLEVLLDQNLSERAIKIGSHIRNKLSHPLIKEVRGRGAMLGMALVNADTTSQAVADCLDKGLLLGWTLHSNSLVRVAPPLTIPFDVLDDALNIILEALDRVLVD